MIIQIIPANGWYAVFRKPTSQVTFSEPIICWALREVQDGFGVNRFVVGLNREGIACSDLENFVEYVYDPDAHNKVRSVSAINSELFK